MLWMQVPYVRGLASHNGSESCAYVGNCVSEALTGVGAGQVLSREIKLRSADTVGGSGRQAVKSPSPAWLLWQDDAGLRAVRDPVHVPRHPEREPGDPIADQAAPWSASETLRRQPDDER
jgi:hypothetical protein